MMDSIRIAARFLSKEEVELGDNIISSLTIPERQVFHDLFTTGCPISDTTVDEDDSGNRVISVGTRPTRYISSGHLFRGISADIFMDDGQLTRTGRIVKARWRQRNSPLRLEFEKEGERERARREKNWADDAVQTRADITKYNSLIADGNSVEQAEQLMRQ